jgi:hypothetical protein
MLINKNINRWEYLIKKNIYFLFLEGLSLMVLNLWEIGKIYGNEEGEYVQKYNWGKKNYFFYLE